jgi:Tfp pilus assembly protein PilN
MEETHNKTLVRRSTNIRQHMRSWLIISIGFFAIVLLTLGIVTVIKNRALDDLKVYEQGLVQEIAELDNLLNQKKLLEEEQQKLSQRLDKMNTIGNTACNNPYQYLQKIATIIPDGVVLKSFVFDKKMRLEGFSDTVQHVTQFMHLLAKTPIFKSIQLISMDRHKKTTHDAHDAFDALGAGKVWFVIEVLKI